MRQHNHYYDIEKHSRNKFCWIDAKVAHWNVDHIYPCIDKTCPTENRKVIMLGKPRPG